MRRTCIIVVLLASTVLAEPQWKPVQRDTPTAGAAAIAPTSDPARVTKDAANPVFTGSDEDWDRYGVRETEILRGPSYFHIFYGGYNGSIWQLGHMRTRDFRTFQPNPTNPILTPNEDPDAWDSGELLTPHVFEVNGDYYMLYAGLKGRGWGGDSECGSGLAVARRS